MLESKCMCVNCERLGNDPLHETAPSLPKCNCYEGEHHRMCPDCAQNSDRSPESKKALPYGCPDHIPAVDEEDEDE